MAPKRTRVTVEAVDGGTGGREGPYVMTFAAGSAPPELSCAVFTKPGASRHATLVGHTDAVDYVGTNFGPEAAGALPCNNAVGLYDPTEGTLKLVPLGGDRVIRMQPRIREVSYAAPEYTPPPSQEEAKEDSRADQIERAVRLARSFGREALQRKRDNQKVSRIEVKHISAPEGVEAGLAHAACSELTNAEIYMMASGARNIPPHNKDAVTPDSAYPFDGIVTPSEQAALKDVVARLNKAYDNEHELQAMQDSGKYHALVIQYMRLEKKPGERRRHFLCVAYLNALLELMKSRFVLQQRDLGSLHLPPALQTALLEKFAEVETEAPQKRNDIIAPAEATEEVARRVQYQRPQQKRDLLLCYILLLCLMINDYDIGLKELAMEFQLQPKQLSLYFSELGCVVTAKRQQGGEEKSSTLRARLLQADARGRTLEELLPNRKPRPKAQRRG